MAKPNIESKEAIMNISQKGNVVVAVSIVVAGALIAAALYYALGAGGTATQQPPIGDDTPKVPIAGVQADDHIIGNSDATVVIVEYSDTECPYCKQYHETLQQITDEYDASEVAWVYRHFPLIQLHPKAPKEAEATECAAELAGNDGFWAYTNRLFEITPSNNGLDLDQLPEIAEYAGIDRAAFEACLQSGDMTERVNADYDEVVAAGGRGTPHNIILFGDQQIPVEGGQSFGTMKQIIDQLLASE
jgi:protein-disulfide isomerase